MLKSIKIHAVSTMLLTIVCVMLIILNIIQGVQYQCNLNRLNQKFEQAMDEQTDKYLELVKAEEPIKTNYQCA